MCFYFICCVFGFAVVFSDLLLQFLVCKLHLWYTVGVLKLCIHEQDYTNIITTVIV